MTPEEIAYWMWRYPPEHFHAKVLGLMQPKAPPVVEPPKEPRYGPKTKHPVQEELPLEVTAPPLSALPSEGVERLPSGRRARRPPPPPPQG